MLFSSTRTKGGRSRQQRRGTVIALVALTIVILLGFLGLAIDIGMLAIAKTQAQNAADVAALTAARTINGDKTLSSPYNQDAATTNAKAILSYNAILGQSIQASQLTLTYGSYDYNQSTQTFNANFPATSGVPLTATAATVTSTNLAGAFSKVFGSQFLPNVTATAQAVHRPRDIAFVADLSGSMRMGTCLGYDFYSNSRVSNNPDTAVPTFGHYSSASAVMTATSSTRTSAYDNYSLPGSNTTVGNSSYTLTYINGFYQNAAYASTLVRAFDSYTSTDGGTTWIAPSGSATPQLPPSTYTSVPGGDRPLYFNGSSTNFAQEVEDVLGSTTRNARWELDGYSTTTNGQYLATDPLIGKSNYSTAPFYGYTKGPNYYGKTFFLWPPDPRRPLNTGTATAWSTTATDIATIKQFLADFGYTAADFSTTSTTSVTTTLGAAITNSATSLTVAAASAAKFPVNPFTSFKIIVGTEIMVVTAVSGASKNTWTVQRGKDGTTAAAQANNATVGLVTMPPLVGIYTAANTNTSPGKTPSTSQTWPWPNDSAAALATYLQSNVYIPGSQVTTTNQARYLLPTDDAYQKIMRLYNWNYVVDNYNAAGTGATFPGTTPCDWRIRFFGTDDNTVLFNASGSLNPPGSTGMCSATATYNEILRWLAQSTDPFPTQLRAGRIKYYNSIPTSITGTWPSYGGTDQRFWVEVIDHILGFRQTSAGSYTDISAMAGYGADFTWGTMQRTSPPGSPAGATQYMNYQDNPLRPLLRHWFSPILMVDYLHSYNLDLNTTAFCMQPGDTYEAPLYTAKQAYLACIKSMESNHPNDWFTFIPYSYPRTSASSVGRLNCVSCPLGTNYAYAKAALFFPFSTINADGTNNNTEVTPYDPDPATGSIPSHNFVDTPRADGDTCFSMGLMLAFNQFAVTPSSDTNLRTYVTSTPITFPTAMAGGMGRKGAQKLVIFETDGLANTTATSTLTSGGTYSYYPIRYDMNRPSSSEYPSSTVYNINNTTVLTEVYGLVDQLKATYGTTRNPFRLYTIGFGPVFNSGAPDSTSAQTTLQTMQFHAGTQASAATALPSNQIITGTDAQMAANMIATYTSLLQNGVQIALIK